MTFEAFFSYAGGNPCAERSAEILRTCGDFADGMGGKCPEKGERSIRLGKREYEVLRILMSARGSIVSKETMIVKTVERCVGGGL